MTECIKRCDLKTCSGQACTNRLMMKLIMAAHMEEVGSAGRNRTGIYTELQSAT